MCVCMCAHVYMDMCVSVYVCFCICVFLYMCVSVYVCFCICVFLYVVYVYVCLYMCNGVCWYVRPCDPQNDNLGLMRF